MRIKLLLVEVLIIEILFFATLISGQNYNDSILELIEPRANALEKLRTVMQLNFNRNAWCDVGASCNEGRCAKHACNGGGFGDEYKCDILSPVPSVCGEDRREFCKESEVPNGILLNRKSTTVRTDIGTVSASGDGFPMIISNLKVRRDICSFKKMNDDFVRLYEEYKLQHWFYAGSSNGATVSMPGRAIPSCANGLENCGFNPTRRPWYIRASSGPKDVVFLFDATSNGKSKTLRKALFDDENNDSPLLDSLSHQDYVAVVAYNNQEANVIGSDKLERKNDELVKSIRDNLPVLPGKANIQLAIEKGFQLLQEGRDSGTSSQCSRIIVLLMGSADVCFEKCSQNAPCRCVQDIRDSIQSHQKFFSENPVSIVVFTETGTSDVERIGRTIVCDRNNDGLWRRVTKQDSGDNLLASYSQLVATTLFEDAPDCITSEPYEDFAGLGKVFTVSIPVYADRRLVGVAAADVPVEEVQKALNVSAEVAEAEIEKLSGIGQCYNRKTKDNACLLQELRSLEDNSAICADMYPREYNCYKFGSTIYVTQQEELSWEDAQARCRDFGANVTLAKISGSGVNRFIAAFASADGSWVGANTLQTDEFKWDDGQVVTLSEAEIGFQLALDELENGRKEIRDKYNERACISVDRRGVDENWNIEPCSALRPFICQVSASEVKENSGFCRSGIFEEESTRYTSINPREASCTGKIRPAPCTSEQEKDIQEADPLCLYQNSSFTDFDRTCCGGGLSSSPPCSNWWNIFSAECRDWRKSLLLTIFITVVIALLASLIYWIYKYVKRDSPAT